VTSTCSVATAFVHCPQRLLRHLAPSSRTLRELLSRGLISARRHLVAHQFVDAFNSNHIVLRGAHIQIYPFLDQELVYVLAIKSSSRSCQSCLPADYLRGSESLIILSNYNPRVHHPSRPQNMFKKTKATQVHQILLPL
jgi:hypothetical protein